MTTPFNLPPANNKALQDMMKMRQQTAAKLPEAAPATPPTTIAASTTFPQTGPALIPATDIMATMGKTLVMPTTDTTTEIITPPTPAPAPAPEKIVSNIVNSRNGDGDIRVTTTKTYGGITVRVDTVNNGRANTNISIDIPVGATSTFDPKTNKVTIKTATGAEAVYDPKTGHLVTAPGGEDFGPVIGSFIIPGGSVYERTATGGITITEQLGPTNPPPGKPPVTYPAIP